MVKSLSRLLAVMMTLAAMMALIQVMSGESVYAEEKVSLDLPYRSYLLTDWDQQVEKRVHAEVWEDDELKDEGFAEVTDVQIKSQKPDSGKGKVLDDPEFEEYEDDPDNGRWRLRALSYGSAEVDVAYTFNGKNGVHTIRVYVSENVYNINAWSDNGYYKGLPGMELDLSAWAEKKFRDEYGNEQSTDDGLRIHWAIEEDCKDLAEITPFASDEYRAVLEFKDLPEGSHSEQVFVRTWVTDDNADDPEAVCMAWITDFRNEDLFFQIEPTMIDSDMNIGKSDTIEPVVKRYELNKEVTEVEDVTYEFKDVDEQVVSIDQPDKNKDKYIVTRTGNWYTEFQLVARWENDGYADIMYHLNERNYDIWYGGDLDVWDVGKTDAELEVSGEVWSLLDDDDYLLEYDLGDWDKEGFHQLDGYEKYITVDPEEKTKVLIDGEKLAADDIGYTRLRASLYRLDKGEKVSLINEANTGLHIRESFVDYHLREDQRIVRGWDINIDHFERGWAENKEYENGIDFEYEIKSVELVDPDASRYVAIRKEYADDDEKSDDYWWKIKGVGYGSAEIEVTYLKWEGDPEYDKKEYKYRFTVESAEDLYEAYVDAETDLGLPGAKIGLHADVRYAHWREDEGYDEEWNDEIEGLTFEWSIVNGSEFAKVESVPGKPREAVVTMRELPEGSGWEDVDVKVVVKKDGKTAAEEQQRLNLSNDYYEIWGPGHNEELIIGDSEDLTLELRHYYVDCESKDKYDLVDDVAFKWWYLDEAVQVKDSAGHVVGNDDGEGHYNDSEESHGKQVKFTVKRNNNWWTEFEVEAEFKRKEGWNDHRIMEFRFSEFNLDMWFDQYNDRVFDDKESTEFTVNTENVEDFLKSGKYELRYCLGYWDDHGTWTNMDGYDQYLTTVAGKPEKVQINGKKLYEHFGEETGFHLRVDLVSKETEESLCDESIWLDLCHTREFVEFREHWDILKGDRAPIPAELNIRVENSEDPYGEEEHVVKITDLEIQQHPWTGSDKVVSEPEEIKDGDKLEGWLVFGLDTGDAEVTMKYKNLDGKDDEWSMYIHVRSEVYDMDLKSVSGSHTTVPGGTIDLQTRATVRTPEDPDGKEPEGKFYYWFVHDGDENPVDTAAVTADKSDPQKASVKFKDFDPDQYEAEVFVTVILCTRLNRDGTPAKDSELQRTEIRLEARREYMEIAPAVIDASDLAKPAKVTPKTVRYAAGEDPEVQKYVNYSWNFNDSDLSVTCADGTPVQQGKKYPEQEFVIERKTLEPTSIQLEAYWINEYADEDRIDQWYDLDGLYFKYQLSVSPEEPELISTGRTTCTLDMSSFDGVTGLSVEFEATVRNGDNVIDLVKDKDFTVNDNTITLSGPAVSTKGTGIIGVIAYVMRGKTELSDFYFEITQKEKCDVHDLVEHAATAETCTTDGNIQYWQCSKCDLCFVDKEGKTPIAIEDTVIKAHHTIERVPLKKATDKKTGNIEYWRCTVCEKCFSDAEGKTEIDQASTVIPKNNFKVTVKKKVFKAKANKKTTLKAKNLYKVTGKKGKVTYKKSTGDKKITVAKNGNITVKKGLKKNKTYTVKIKVTSAATSKYAKCTKTISVKIKIS